MGFVLGFLPWILYWVLVGNVDFRLAVCIALVASLGTQVISRRRGQPWRSLEVGSLLIFVLLAVAAFVVNEAVLERWLQPLSNLGFFLVALVGVLIGRPFVREYAASSVDAETARTNSFRVITTGMTWLWVTVLGAMTIISAIPPIVDGSASIRDEDTPLSILCYWVLPFMLLGIAGMISGLFPAWFEKRSALVDQRQVSETPNVASQAAAPGDLSSGPLRLDMPANGAHDEQFGVVVHGAPPSAGIDLSASGSDLYGQTWRSTATFIAPNDGPLDLASAGPAGGDWSEPDADAVLWAMRFATPDRTPNLFVAPLDPWQVTVAAEVSGVGQVRRTVLRRAGADGVRLEPVTMDGLPGLLARPPGDAPVAGWPAVACFGGSEGGFESQAGNAVLLASHGYAALAASWVAEDEAAKKIASIPLERFTGALNLLRDHPQINADRVAGMAVSRGAEGLLAAVGRIDDPLCRGLILISPSSVTWQAIGSDGEVPDTPSWTWGGAPVPWLALPTGELMSQLIRNAWRIGRDTADYQPTLLRLRPAYEAGLQKRSSALGDASIAAERAICPLLLLTGSDDDVWPSEQMAEELLSRRGSGVGDQHIHYAGAGHLIRLGIFPTDAQWTNGISLGGTREGQAAAQRDATGRVLSFLKALLRS